MSAWHFTLHGQPAGFAQPWALCLAACALVVGALFVARAVGGRTRVSRWVSPRLMPRLLPDRPRLRRALASGFSVVGIALLCVALARPLWGAHEEAAARRGIDVVVALDASRSMLATDVAPNRMARAKLELETLLSGLQGDRVGLVTFAGSAFVQMPLTGDYAAAQMFLRAVDPAAMPEGGTDIGGGLRQAKEVLDHAEHGAKERAVVLLSDGEDWGDDAVAAAEALKRAGVHLYAVGIGSPAGVPLPAFDDHGVQRGYRKDVDGKTIVTRLDRQGLDKIARAGGGEAFWRPRGVAVGEVVQRIEAMQKSDLETRRVTSYIERYQWPLGAGLLLTMLGMALPTGARTQRRHRRTSATVASAAALVVAMLLGGRAHAAGVLHHPEAATARGTAAYGHGEYAAALAAFQAAHPKGADAEVEYDRGTALFKLGRYQEAKAAFARSAALAPRARALYDLGNTEAALKDEAGAIAAYRKALGVDPDDAAARHNLEVMLQKKQDEKNKQKQQQKDQKQQAGNQQQKDQNGKGDQQKQKQKQAGNQQQKDQNGKSGQPKQQQQQAAQLQPPTGHALDRAAQARADTRLTPDAARILDSMRTVDRTLPLSRFAPPTPRSAHEKDW